MDNLTPPEELQHLWLDAPEKTEDPTAIVTHVLREARKHQRRARAADIFCMALCVVLLPLMLALALIFWDKPLMVVGHLIYIATLVISLAMYRRFHRSLGTEPPPNATSREYAEYSIEYLNRRERLWVKSALPCSALVSATGIVFAMAAANGQQPDISTAWVVLCFVSQPLNWWLVSWAHRKNSKRRTRLREILADLDREPQR